MSKTTIYLSDEQKEFIDECKRYGITNNFIFNQALQEFMEKHQNDLLRFKTTKEVQEDGLNLCISDQQTE